VRTGETKDCRIPVNQKNIQAFNRYVNSDSGLLRHYELVEDIVLPKPAAGESNWIAISNDSYTFAGSFDGNKHTISGLTIHNPNADYQGLFGYIGQTGEVENLGLIGSSVRGYNRVGGVVGYNEGRVENCYSGAKVQGAQYVGGVVGSNWGTVQNVYATGDVSGNWDVGGVTGSGGVANCYATGEVSNSEHLIGGTTGYHFGGITGYSAASIQNCLALNPRVTNTSEPGTSFFSYVGRVLGLMNGAETIQNCFAFEKLLITGSTWTGQSQYDGTDITAVQLQTEDGFPAELRSGPWTYQPGRLPGLLGQTVEMPVHLQTP
jgi:hypothetical protein